MPGRLPETEIRRLPGEHSSSFRRLARERQRAWFKQLEVKGKRDNRKALSPQQNNWPKADPNTYYEVSQETLVKGCQFAERILPVNAKAINPSLAERIKMKWQLLKEKLAKIL